MNFSFSAVCVDTNCAHNLFTSHSLTVDFVRPFYFFLLLLRCWCCCCLILWSIHKFIPAHLLRCIANEFASSFVSLSTRYYYYRSHWSIHVPHFHFILFKQSMNFLSPWICVRVLILICTVQLLCWFSASVSLIYARAPTQLKRKLRLRENWGLTRLVTVQRIKQKKKNLSDSSRYAHHTIHTQTQLEGKKDSSSQRLMLETWIIKYITAFCCCCYCRLRFFSFSLLLKSCVFSLLVCWWIHEVYVERIEKIYLYLTSVLLSIMANAFFVRSILRFLVLSEYEKLLQWE